MQFQIGWYFSIKNLVCVKFYQHMLYKDLHFMYKK